MKTQTETNKIPGGIIDSLYHDIDFNTTAFKTDKQNIAFLMLGASGSGKESRGKYLVKRNNLEAKISSGDIFRNKIFKGFTKEDMKKIQTFGQENENRLKAFAKNYSAITDFFKTEKIDYFDDEDKAVAIFQALNGLFVDDDILLKYADKQISKYKGKGIVLDGHIRTGNQVEGITKILKKNDIELVGALLVHTPIYLLETRTVGRLSCPDCKREYNTTAKEDSEHFPNRYFEKEGLGWGYCHDHPDIELKRRSDDYPGKVMNRLKEYIANIGDVLNNLNIIKIPIYGVSGTLEPYSKQELGNSIEETLSCDNDKVRERLGI